MGFGGLGAAVCPPPDTFSLSARLLSGPFHWMMSWPRSSRKTSPRLKLFQLISTCSGMGRGQDVSPPTSTCPVRRCLHPDGMVLGR